MKKTITAHDKASIALQALAGGDTLATIASKHHVHPIQVGVWRKTVKENLYTLFDSTHNESKRLTELKEQVDELHRIIGRRDEELAWLQKKVAT